MVIVLCSYSVNLSSLFVRCVYDYAAVVVCSKLMGRFPVSVREESFDGDGTQFDDFGFDYV